MNTNTAIKTWQERNGESRGAGPFGQIEKAMCAEIADLRTALEAAQQQLAAIEPPSFSRDPDGDLALDWRVGDASLSVSFSTEGSVAWAATIAGKAFSGAEQVAQRAGSGSVTRTKLSPMQSEEDQDAGIVRQWYFDCDGHYIDVALDNGKYSIFFRDRATQGEGWLDQSEQPDSERDAALAEAAKICESLVQYPGDEAAVDSNLYEAADAIRARMTEQPDKKESK